MMKVSLVIPYIVETDLQQEILERCVSQALHHSSLKDTEIVLIDNGSPRKLTLDGVRTVRNEKNVGVLASFPQGYAESSGDIVAFTHSDVLFHGPWDAMISDAFEADANLGLAGLFGAMGLHPDGNRENCFSNMLGLEYGKCGCHEIAAFHHGNRTVGTVPAAMFDGVGLFFRRETMTELLEGDTFASWRAPHHFYDRIISLKVAELGYHMAVVGVGFDHWSGATAGGSKIYDEAAYRWLDDNGYEIIEERIPDQIIYNIAEQQFFSEWRDRLPLKVDPDYTYRWNA